MAVSFSADPLALYGYPYYSRDMNTKTRSYDKLYKNAKDRAITAAGGAHAFQKMLTPTLRKAMVAEEILFTVYAQDEDHVSGETVREMVAELRDRLTDDEDVML